MIGSLCALLYFSKLNLASWCEMDLCVFFFFYFLKRVNICLPLVSSPFAQKEWFLFL